MEKGALSIPIFLKRFVLNPFSVGSMAPSSPQLTGYVAHQVIALKGLQTTVLEIGAGTGVFSDALIKKGVCKHNLTLVENDPTFAGILQKKFPNVLSDNVLDITFNTQYDCVISSLPIRNFSKPLQSQLLSCAVSILKPNGLLIQYSYMPFWPFKHAHIKEVHKQFVLKNFPPAFVFIYQKL